MSGYVSVVTGKKFTHGCDECAGAVALLQVTDEEKR